MARSPHYAIKHALEHSERFGDLGNRQALFDHVGNPIVDMGRLDSANRHRTEPRLDSQPPRSLMASPRVRFSTLRLTRQ
jgi:hypothetical protein